MSALRMKAVVVPVRWLSPGIAKTGRSSGSTSFPFWLFIELPTQGIGTHAYTFGNLVKTRPEELLAPINLTATLGKAVV